MNSIAPELETIIDKHIKTLHAISENDLSKKPSPEKWSKKEIMGHMIDSAQNNIRRFIVAQYEDKPTIIYKQDKWVAISQYQHYNQADLINLWYLLNKHICHILKNTSPEMFKRECHTEDLHSLEWLAADYVTHLQHHLHQVLDLEPVPY
jgi:hypothetical protein